MGWSAVECSGVRCSGVESSATLYSLWLSSIKCWRKPVVLIKKLLAKLPGDIVKLELEETLRANGLCRVRCIRRLADEKLHVEDLGVSMGDGILLLDVLHTEQAPASAGAPAEQRQEPAASRPVTRPFPKCVPGGTADNPSDVTSGEYCTRIEQLSAQVKPRTGVSTRKLCNCAARQKGS